jgi:hypothetical protein
MGDSAGNDHALLDGAKADLWLGGKAAAGDVVLFRSGESDNRNTAKATIRFDAQASSLRMRDSSGNDHALLDGANANLWLGGEAADGDIVLFRSGESDNRNTAKASIHLNAQAGDIILGNADCAEDFEVAELDEAQPGTVMVIDDEGRLRQSRIAYDKRVAGVVSGACDSRPGIVLDRHVGHGSRRPLALIGKTYCKADAGYSQISVGDLLTTSSTPGHAMKATDQHHAFGAVIGKALQPLCDGQAMIPILINLQ